MHRNLAEADACHRRRTQAAEKEAIETYHRRLDELSARLRPASGPPPPLPAAVESATETLDRIFGALVIVAVPLLVAAIGFAIQHARG